MIDYNNNPFRKAMEYSPGDDLANRMNEKNVLNLPRIRNIEVMVKGRNNEMCIM